jgi:tripartite-type tricarboxylate transporter receptor subunit TctC
MMLPANEKWSAVIRLLSGLVFLILAAASASAQTFPAKLVRLIVPYPAGGAADLIARAVAQRLGEIWNQPVVIENKSGAGSQIGAEYVARSSPDGFTLLATSEATFSINPFLYRRLAYDVNDFTPVSGLGAVNQILVVHPSVPIYTVWDLISQASANPGQLTYASIGLGSAGHLNMEMFQSMAGVKLTAVHYRGGAPAFTDIIGGHVPLGFISFTLAAQSLQSGHLRAIGVGSVQRSPVFPDVPTIAEAGVPGFDAVTWYGLFAPKGTPADVVVKINADVQRVLAEPSFQNNFLARNFFEPIKGSPQDFAEFVRKEATKWEKVIKGANLSVE